MEINNVQNYIINNNLPVCNNGEDNTSRTHQTVHPAFRGHFDKILNKSGDIMHRIENGGFLVLFLIQDFLGMTLPRTYAGFLRDKEVTGEYNIQEGFEVLGREGLTGPCMMAVAPLSLWLASKGLGKSTSINTELIKAYGNNLKEMVSSPEFNSELLNDAGKFKNEFYKRNIENIINSTIDKPLTKEEMERTVNYITKQLEHYENIPKDTKLSWFMGKSKYKTECMENIQAFINDLKYKSSADLDMLQRVKLNKNKVFDTKKAFEGLIKYSDDTITANKNLKKLDGLMAEKLKHSALGKRVLINIGMVFATLGVLSVLPKLYLRSDTAPGARKIKKQEENVNTNPSFKGKNTNIIEKLGKAVEKNKSNFVSSELEYNGHNFTNTMMAGLSIFGLIIPRCLRAYSRAQVDENGKKDKTELWEIIIRDVRSSLAVVFAVPMITRAFVTSYEKNSGFVLMQKDRTKTGFKTVLDLFNPYSKAHVLSNAEITALYDGVNSKEKMVNFCKYIDKNGGDLQKILSKSESVSEIFNEKTKTLAELKKLTKVDANKQITEIIENLEANAKKMGKNFDKKSIDNLISKVMKTASKGRNSKITAMARGLNSVPGLLTTLFISPYILGWCIPRLTYKNTRRIHEKQDREREEKAKLKATI